MLSETQAAYGLRAASSRVSSASSRSPCRGSIGEELARPQARPADADALGERDRARFRGDGDEPVVADRHAERAQAVPVELRPAGDAVREDEPGGAVPRLDRHRVVAAHRALRLVDPGVVLPRGRDESRQRLVDVEAGADEQLDGVVEERRVGAAAIERRREARVEAARTLARLHPRGVALDRVDLAVVAEQAERLGALPARLGVRREALVEDRERRGPALVPEIEVEAGELGRRAERLVRDRAERERRDVDAVHELRAPASPVRALLGVLVVARREHELRDPGHGRERRRPERGHVDRHVAPAERLEPLRSARLLDDAAEPRLAQEAHRDPRAGGPGQRVVEREQDARTVARDAVGRPGAAMRDGGEAGERPVDELARRAPLRVGDEADAAGVALEGLIVEKRRSCQGLPPSGSWTSVRSNLPPVSLSASPAGAGDSPASARAAR